MADLVLQNTAEGGSDGAAVVAATSGGGSGDAFGTTSGGAWTYEAEAARGGALGYRLVPDGTSRYLRGDDPSPEGRGGGAVWHHYSGSAPTASYPVIGLRTASDTATGSITIYTDGKPYLYNRSGTRVTASGSGVSALEEGWYRFQMLVTPGATSTDGRAEVKVWDAANNLVMSYDTGTGFDIGTTDPVARTRFGGLTSGAGLATFDIDNAVWGHVATGDLPDVANAPPEVTLTAPQNVTASSTVTVSATAADPDGSVASYAWTVLASRSTSTPTLTGDSTPAVTFTAPAAGNLVTLQCVVTDNLGATTTATTEVRVPASGSTTVGPLALNGTNVVGTMNNVGGATSDGAALSDSSDTTYIESGSVSGTEQSERYRLAPTGIRTTAAITARLGTDTGTANAVVRLYEGTTLRQTWTQAITATPTDYTFTVSSGTLSAISDWASVAVEVGFTS